MREIEKFFSPCYSLFFTVKTFMKVMIFAAGLGTRLKPLTDAMPKALVPVAGKPLLDRVIERVMEAGASEIVVNVHHFAEYVKKHIASCDWSVPVRISDESSALLDTGGGLRHAASFFTNDESPILIHNVDILSNADLKIFYENIQCDDAALLVSGRETQRYLLFDESDRLCGWTNVATGEVRTPYEHLELDQMKRLAFSGIHVISMRLLKEMNKWPEAFPIMDFYLSACAKTCIRGYEQPGFKMLDVGKLSALEKASKWLDSVK